MGAAEGVVGHSGWGSVKETAREHPSPRPAAEETQSTLPVALQEPGRILLFLWFCIPSATVLFVYAVVIMNSLSIFQPKSAEQREKVRKASTEGIAIQGQQGSRLLPEQLLKEAFILSDLFDIGELAALELLLAGKVSLTCPLFNNMPFFCFDNDLIKRSSEFLLMCPGEQQQPHFPGLTRGLVAVLLYWDGKLCVANSLRTLIQSRHGKTFTLDLR